MTRSAAKTSKIWLSTVHSCVFYGFSLSGSLRKSTWREGSFSGPRRLEFRNASLESSGNTAPTTNQNIVPHPHLYHNPSSSLSNGQPLVTTKATLRDTGGFIVRFQNQLRRSIRQHSVGLLFVPYQNDLVPEILSFLKTQEGCRDHFDREEPHVIPP